jgi:hypothetical protein
MLSYATLTSNELSRLTTEELFTLPISIGLTEFVTDLLDRRRPITNGGNPHRFMELVGGQEILYQFYEPDANTTRELYYYNTRTNILYKRIEVTNPGTNRRYSIWKQISEC